MPTWPTDLPQKPLRGYKEDPEDQALRDNPDIGTHLGRPLASAYGTNFQMGMLMTNAQITSLLTFYYTTVASGTLPFDWIHPREKTSGKFLFKARPAWKQESADLYRVTIKLYLKP